MLGKGVLCKHRLFREPIPPPKRTFELRPERNEAMSQVVEKAFEMRKKEA